MHYKGSLRFCFFLAAFFAVAAARGDWESTALDALKKGDTRIAMKFAEHPMETGDRHAKILMFAAYALDYDKDHNAGDFAKSKALYMELLDKVDVSDAELLHQLRKINGSVLPSYSEAMLDLALRRVRSPEQALAVPQVIDTVFKSEQNKVYAGLSEWLRDQQANMIKGQVLEPDIRNVFTNERLISALARYASKAKSQKAATAAEIASAPPMGSLPVRGREKAKQAMPRTNATARECLLLMEEPAIPVVEGLLPELGTNGPALISDLYMARTIRRNEYPGSTWYSRAGTN
jgi:hypothetical protein